MCTSYHFSRITIEMHSGAKKNLVERIFTLAQKIQWAFEFLDIFLSCFSRNHFSLNAHVRINRSHHSNVTLYCVRLMIYFARVKLVPPTRRNFRTHYDQNVNWTVFNHANACSFGVIWHVLQKRSIRAIENQLCWLSYDWASAYQQPLVRKFLNSAHLVVGSV